MRVLVTDSDTRPALAAVRALGRRGHEVFTAGPRHPSLASASRFSKDVALYPDPAKDTFAFMPAVVEAAKRFRVDAVLPITEVTTLLVTEHRNLLPSGCQVPFPDFEIVRNAANKAYVIGLAQQIGVPTPRTLVVQTAAEGIERASELPFPIVVKPARSRVRSGSGWLSTGVSYALDPSSLRDILQKLAPETFPVLLQERLDGPGTGVFACMDRGEPIALFAHRRIREKPPSGGVSVLCESAPLDPVVTAHSVRLLQEIGWRGPAMVEYKRDLRDGGTPRLMEINGRFWGSLQLAIDADVDFPSLAVESLSGAAVAAPRTYRTGVRSRWLAGDLDALLMVLFKSSRSLRLPPSHPGRLRAIWDFLHMWSPQLHYEIERRDDPAPARLEWTRPLRR